jgi:MFS family permease
MSSSFEKVAAGEGLASAGLVAADEMAGRGWRKTFSALENPHYRMLWSGMLFSFMSMQMHMIARGLLAFRLEGNASSLGLVTAAWGVPLLILSLYGGVVADRAEKRDLLIWSQATLGATVLAIAVLVHADVIKLWHLIVVGVVQGTVFAFNMPSRQALIPELVRERDLLNAIALNSAGMNVTRILGPALAGGLIAVPFIGFRGVYYLMAFFYLVVILTLLRIPRTGPALREKGSVLSQMASGLRYVRASRLLMVLIALGFVPVVLGAPYSVLLPVFSEEVFHVGSAGLGVMGMAAGAGAVIGSLTVASMTGFRRSALVQLVGGAGFGAALVLFGASGTFVLALLALALVGVTFQGYASLNNTMVLSNTQPEYHGRVMSIYMMNWSVMPLAALPMAALADVIGVRITVMVAGALVALVFVVVGGLSPELRHLDETPAMAAADGPRGR